MSDVAIEMLMDATEPGISDCCYASVMSNICTCCFEPCSLVSEEDE